MSALHPFYNSAISSKLFPRQPRNNSLHDAILAGDVKPCLSLIQACAEEIDGEADVFRTKSYRLLTQVSLGNSPLMLAMKLGLFDVAKAILKIKDSDEELTISHLMYTDCRGLTPFHYACAYRQDELIIMMQEMGFNAQAVHQQFVEQSTQKWSLYHHSLRKSFMPELLYAQEWDCELSKVNGFDDLVIQDSHGFYVDMKNPSQSIMTDMFFHMDKICVNLSVCDAQEFQRLEAKTVRSCDFYKLSVRHGYEPLAKHRNAIEVSPQVKEALQEESFRKVMSR